MRRALFEVLAFLAFVLALCLLYATLRSTPQASIRTPVQPADMPQGVYNPNRVLIV